MPARNTIVWGFVLFALWVLLSAKLDPLHLGMGAACAAAVAVTTRPLLALPPALRTGAADPVTLRLVVRFLLYLPWLLWQIVVASLQVARLVLHPRLPIEPRLVRIQTRNTLPLARLTLANSITLTPGTVTVDVAGDELVVHALTEANARALVDGGMETRVARVFLGSGGESEP